MTAHVSMRGIGLLAAACLAIRLALSSGRPSPPMGGEIESALTRSAGGWNTGNLDRFVAIYLDSDRTTFATASRYLHGRAAIRAYYAPRFTPGVARDSLRMENIAIDSLSPRLANVMAFYVLSHGDSIAARGPTSLLMERVRGTWYIVHDHSS